MVECDKGSVTASALPFSSVIDAVTCAAKSGTDPLGLVSPTPPSSAGAGSPTVLGAGSPRWTRSPFLFSVGGRKPL